LPDEAWMNHPSRRVPPRLARRGQVFRKIL
jgi:hypothetical protein